MTWRDRSIAAAIAISVAAVALAAIAGVASAQPRKTLVAMDAGTVASASGLGCSLGTVSASYDGTAAEFAKADPGVGETLESDPSLVVEAVRTEEGRVTWTVGPSDSACAQSDSPDALSGEYWVAYDEAWSVFYAGRRYVIEAVDASGRGRLARGIGIKTLAGLKVERLMRRGRLTIRSVSRALGRPTRVQGGSSRHVCYASWDRIGLRVAFVTYGHGRPCRVGSFQTATIRGPRARGWVAQVDDIYGVAYGTSRAYMRASGYGLTSGGIALAEKWLPYGEWSLQPTIEVRFGGADSRVREFRLYVGAAGD